MHIKITLSQIKQEAKDLKQSNSNLKHTQALNKIAQKYGYERFEILKAKFSKKSYIEIEIDIAEPISFLNTQTSNETFNPIQNLSEHGIYADVFNAPSPEVDVTEEDLKKVLDNVSTRVNFKSALQRLENKHIAIIGGAGAGKSTLLFQEHSHLDKKDTLILTPLSKNSFNGYAHQLERESYKKCFKKPLPVFKNATSKTHNSADIDFAKFGAIVIDESFTVLKNKKLLSDIIRIIADGSKTIIMTFQSKDDAKNFGFNINHILDIRDYSIRSVSLDLYEISVAGAGMSYAGQF